MGGIWDSNEDVGTIVRILNTNEGVSGAKASK